MKKKQTCGSLPNPPTPALHPPSLNPAIPAPNPLSAPSMRKTAVSAVASSTAVGTLLTLSGGSRALQAATSIWS